MPKNNRLNPQTPVRGPAENLISALDTYYSPARDRMGAQAMVQGFNSAANLASKLSNIKLNEEVQAAQQQAQNDAQVGDDPAEEFRQVRMGNMFRPASRAYMQAYDTTRGRMAAMDFRDNLTLEYERGGWSRNTDPNAFREWFDSQTAGFIEENRSNNFFMAGAMPIMEQVTFNMSAQHMSNINTQLRTVRVQAAAREANDIAMRYYRGELDSNGVMEALGAVNTDYYLTGEDPAYVRGALLDAVLNAADAMDDPELIGMITSEAAAGTLRITPAQLNATVNRGEAIAADIARRVQQADAAATAAIERDERLLEGSVVEFLNNPANLQMSLSELMAQPGVAEVIANSADSRRMVQAVTDTYNLMRTTHEVDDFTSLAQQQAVRDAFNAGEDIMAWARDNITMPSADTMKLVGELAAQQNNPNSAYGTDAYNREMNSGAQAIIPRLVTEGSPWDEAGNDTALTAAIRNQFNEEFAIAAEGINPSQANYQQALRAARNSAMAATAAWFEQNYASEMAKARSGESGAALPTFDGVKASQDGETFNSFIKFTDVNGDGLIDVSIIDDPVIQAMYSTPEAQAAIQDVMLQMRGEDIALAQAEQTQIANDQNAASDRMLIGRVQAAQAQLQAAAQNEAQAAQNDAEARAYAAMNDPANIAADERLIAIAQEALQSQEASDIANSVLTDAQGVISDAVNNTISEQLSVANDIASEVTAQVQSEIAAAEEEAARVLQERIDAEQLGLDLINASYEAQYASEKRRYEERQALYEQRMADGEVIAQQNLANAQREILDENLSEINRLVEQGRVLPAANRVWTTLQDVAPDLTPQEIFAAIRPWAEANNIELTPEIASALEEIFRNELRLASQN